MFSRSQTALGVLLIGSAVLLLLVSGAAAQETTPEPVGENETVLGETPTTTSTTTSTPEQDDGAAVEVSVGDDSTPTPAPEPGEGEVRVQEDLVLVDSRVDDDGTAYLTLRNEGPRMSLTLTDAGAVRQGGTVPRKRTALPEGESTLSMPTTQVDGLRAVTIGTSETLYSVVFDDGSSIFDAPQQNDRLALGTGVGLVLVSALGISRRRNDLDDNGIRRVDE